MADYRDIISCGERLQVAKNGYLRAHGWRETSSTPGCYWMWRRDFADVNDRRLAEHRAFCERIGQERDHQTYPAEILADTDTAIRMTWAEIDPERLAFEDEAD